MIRQQLRKLLPRQIPTWQPVALPAPQEDVAVHFVTSTGSRDVTANNVIAALDPLTIAIGRESPEAGEASAMPVLRFTDRHGGRLLGELELHPSGEWRGTPALDLFTVRRGQQHCISWLHQACLRSLGRLKRRSHAVIPLAPAVVEQAAIFYLCPRPVVLVSVADGGQDNLFPMDLIGPVAGGDFMLALRARSDSIPMMRNSHRVALSDLPPEVWPAVRVLGGLPRGQPVPWDSLPFRAAHSARFGMRVPDAARRVRELEIQDEIQIGSHWLFRARTVSEERRSTGAQCFHTSGLYQELRRRERRGFDTLA